MRCSLGKIDNRRARREPWRCCSCSPVAVIRQGPVAGLCGGRIGLCRIAACRAVENVVRAADRSCNGEGKASHPSAYTDDTQRAPGTKAGRDTGQSGSQEFAADYAQRRGSRVDPVDEGARATGASEVQGRGFGEGLGPHGRIPPGNPEHVFNSRECGRRSMLRAGLGTWISKPAIVPCCHCSILRKTASRSSATEILPLPLSVIAINI